MLICGFYFLKIEFFYVFCKYWVNLQFFSVYKSHILHSINLCWSFFFGGGGGCGNNDLKLKKKKSLPNLKPKIKRYSIMKYSTLKIINTYIYKLTALVMRGLGQEHILTIYINIFRVYIEWCVTKFIKNVNNSKLNDY